MGIGEGKEELWDGGSWRFVVLEASESALSGDFAWRDKWVAAVLLATASLMCAGTRTQANVRSCVTQPPRISQARMSM